MASPSSWQGDPVQEICEAIGRARGTSILRMPKGGLQELLETPRLNPAEWRQDPIALEAELLEGYRDQVAHVLYEASKLALFRSPVQKSRIFHTPTLSGPRIVQRASRLQSKAKKAIDVPTNQKIEAILSRDLDAEELALASARLVPSSRAQIAIAVALLEKNEDSRARECLEGIASNSREDVTCRATADLNLGFIEYRAGDYEAACDRYRRAAQNEGRASLWSAAYWINTAGICGRLSEIPAASAYMRNWTSRSDLEDLLGVLSATHHDGGGHHWRAVIDALRPTIERVSPRGDADLHELYKD